jgi:hypothetical protein
MRKSDSIRTGDNESDSRREMLAFNMTISLSQNTVLNFPIFCDGNMEILSRNKSPSFEENSTLPFEKSPSFQK